MPRESRGAMKLAPQQADLKAAEPVSQTKPQCGGLEFVGLPL